jgi:very-short-patch-repair endonuclease
VGPFVVDFLCREKNLVIEVDGFGHSDAADIRRDARRDDFLRATGLQVFRVNNADVFENLSGVLDGLLLVLNALPSRYRRKGPLSPSDSSPNELGER